MPPNFNFIKVTPSIQYLYFLLAHQPGDLWFRYALYDTLEGDLLTLDRFLVHHLRTKWRSLLRLDMSANKKTPWCKSMSKFHQNAWGQIQEFRENLFFIVGRCYFDNLYFQFCNGKTFVKVSIKVLYLTTQKCKWNIHHTNSTFPRPWRGRV